MESIGWTGYIVCMFCTIIMCFSVRFNVYSIRFCMYIPVPLVGSVIPGISYYRGEFETMPVTLLPADPGMTYSANTGALCDMMFTPSHPTPRGRGNELLHLINEGRSERQLSRIQRHCMVISQPKTVSKNITRFAQKWICGAVSSFTLTWFSGLERCGFVSSVEPVVRFSRLHPDFAVFCTRLLIALHACYCKYLNFGLRSGTSGPQSSLFEMIQPHRK